MPFWKGPVIIVIHFWLGPIISLSCQIDWDSLSIVPSCGHRDTHALCRDPLSTFPSILNGTHILLCQSVVTGTHLSLCNAVRLGPTQHCHAVPNGTHLQSCHAALRPHLLCISVVTGNHNTVQCSCVSDPLISIQCRTEMVLFTTLPFRFERDALTIVMELWLGPNHIAPMPYSLGPTYYSADPR
jgi:hypothetical protein